MQASQRSQQHVSWKSHNLHTEKSSRTSSKLLYVYQWVVLLLLGPPLLVLDILLALPLAVLLWVTGAVEWGKRLAAQRDPVLSKVLEIDSKGSSPMLASLLAFGRVYTSLVAFGLHAILRLFVCIARPKAVFVVYTSNYHLLKRFFCVGTAELIWRAGFTENM